MAADFLVEGFREHRDRPAVIAPAARCSFAELAARCEAWRKTLAETVAPGAVIALEGDFSPATIALLLALAEHQAVVVPLNRSVETRRRSRIAQVEACFSVDPHTDEVGFARSGREAAHPLYAELAARGHPGMVLFSSGTSGEPKAAVHDLVPLLEKFSRRRPALSTIAFLLFDHLGGINTALHALSNGGTVVASGERSPGSVCRAIAEHRVELLPATPTFFNLLLLDGAHRRHDMSSLRVISYGAEPMPPGTLERLRAAFPGVTLRQTYGLIEVGAMRSQSRADDSLWVRVGGEGYETRVVDGVLQIRARSMAMGYLNAPPPLTDDGWLITGDEVLQDGEYLKFLGRRSELIVVGGEKVHPAEVEGVIESLDCVESSVVYGEPHGLVGQIVCAEVTPSGPIDSRRLSREVKRRCRERLEPFKVPARVELADSHRIGDRFKKLRR